ncbi:glycosyltransferase family 39 protein [Flavobacterium urocaniciphilum]|uniref:Dolichyl-phosphate-mannose-protein mannosyltransferase n=1 Tax=Flavobacterium urocaniciphilum TaxID=1299341 RepID=A0A1H9BRK7_9FLAO|nr:glycosyltransferase family 39 protein [Flavobacterium urocaniciphilum]SEP91590.1 Dolichyl-phosphate-mannose-protein mannosyltransferase [Flavobacterium urocaniciphilum]
MNKTKIINFLNEHKLIIIILAVATFLRIFKLDFQSLWLDELYTMNVANPNTGFVDMIKDITIRESFPYLYFIVVKTFFICFGYESTVARIPSMIFGILCVFMIYKLGKELISKKVGLIAAALITLNQFSIYNSQDARAYTFYLFFVLTSYYYLYKFIKKPSKKEALKYAVSAGLLLNTNFFSVTNVLAQGFLLLIFLVFLIDDKKEKIENFKRLMLSIGVIFLFFLPNIYKFYLASQFYSDWIPAPTNGGVTLMIKELVCDSEFVLFIFGILVMFYFIKAFKYPNSEGITKKITDKRVVTFLILISWITFPLIILVLKSYLSTPLYITRYLYSILPAIIIILAISISEIQNNIIKYCILFLIIFSQFVDLTIVKKYYKVPNKTQFREASQLVIDNNKNNEPVYTSLKYWFDFYFKDKFNTIEKPDLEFVINEMMTDSTKIKPFWYTDAHGKPFKLSEKAQQFVDSKFLIDESFDGLDAWSRHFILEKDAVSKFDINQYKPLNTNNGDLAKVWIEVFEKEATSYKISGWGFLENIDSKDNKISIILVNNNEAKVIKCQQTPRTDITKAENKGLNYDNSGFITKIQLSNLQKGEYKIGVFIENKKEHKKGLYLTDKKIIIN